MRDPRLFRSGVELTSINVTVRDATATGRRAQRDAFECSKTASGRQITQFTNERVPVSLGVLLDISDSMFGRRLKDARRRSSVFCSTCSTAATSIRDDVQHRPHVLTTWTSAPDVMRRVLDR